MGGSSGTRGVISRVAVVGRLLLVGALAAGPSLVAGVRPPARQPAIRPMAAVFAFHSHLQEASDALKLATAPLPASFDDGPPPPAVVSMPGPLSIPALALMAYRNAQHVMAQEAPACGISWNQLAGIGRIESLHAFGGATDARGNPNNPIYGPALDGTLPGNEIIVLSAATTGAVYARALGPMQFLPDTWARYAADGDGDGRTDPQNLFDAALGAARYLCSGGLNLRDQSQAVTAVMRYNNSMAYTSNVLGWAAAYVSGVPPVNLPTITGPPPAIGARRAVVAATIAPPKASDAPLPDPGDDAAPRPRGSSPRGTGTTDADGGGSGDTNRGVHSRTRGSAGTGDDAGPVVKVGDGRNGGAR